MSTDKNQDMLVAWMKAQGLDSEDLDGACHELASNEASDINNSGIEAQADFLRLHLGTDDDVKDYLRGVYCIKKDAPVPEEVSENRGPTVAVDVVVRVHMKLPLIVNDDGKPPTNDQYGELVGRAMSELDYDMGEGRSIELGDCRVDIVETEMLDDGTDEVRFCM